MRIIPSATLLDAAKASERFEVADLAMRRGWPEPERTVIDEWNRARRAAEIASSVVIGTQR